MGKFRERVRQTKFDTHKYVVGHGPLSPTYTVDYRDEFTLDDWIPELAPSSIDNFCQVNRSVDPWRCAGLRLNAQGLHVSEAIEWGRKECWRHGMAPKTILVPLSVITPEEAADSMGQYRLFVEDGLRDDTIFLLQEDTWELRGNCLICSAPGLNARMTVSTTVGQTIGPVEKTCRTCGKPNDLGVKSCWWCEAPNPTVG